MYAVLGKSSSHPCTDRPCLPRPRHLQSYTSIESTAAYRLPPHVKVKILRDYDRQCQPCYHPGRTCSLAPTGPTMLSTAIDVAYKG